MRRVILADDTWSPEGFPEVKITYGALTTTQYRQAEAIKDQYFQEMVADHGHKVGSYLAVSPDYVAFVCRHGIRSVSGLEVEDEKTGKVSQLTLTLIEGLYGKCLSDEDWTEFVPFFDSFARDVIAGLIMSRYQKPSTQQVASKKTKSRRSKR